jgi:hypothetical protein
LDSADRGSDRERVQAERKHEGQQLQHEARLSRLAFDSGSWS